MCDNSCAQGAGGGGRRCNRHSRCREQIRRHGGDAAAGAGEEGRSVHQALCGGIVAGVLFGGVLGGVVVGAAAVGASIVSRRNNRDTANRGGGGSGIHVVSCASPAADVATATVAVGGNRGGPSYGGGVTNREEAMLATGRAINATTSSTCAVALGCQAARGAGNDCYCCCCCGGGGGGGGDGGLGGETLSLPSAQPVANLVAIPCTSRSILRARRLTAVTATPASPSNVVFGVPMDCADAAGESAAAPAAATPVAETGRRGHRVSLVPGGGDGGCGSGGTGDSGNGDGVVVTTRRLWRRNTTVGSFGAGGGRYGGSEMENNDDDYVRSEPDGDREEESEEDGWWAGEEYEEDWACLFEAYCLEGGAEGRLPCLVAREPLQGSGVNVRNVRDILRIADWHGRGDLGLDEFFLAMYLCRWHRVEGRVPSMLEAWMIPPTLRETRGCGDNSRSPAYPP